MFREMSIESLCLGAQKILRICHTPIVWDALLYEKYFKDVIREFDEFSGQYSSLQAALLVLVIYYMGELFIGRGPIFCPL